MLPTGNISEAESVSFGSLGSDLQQKQDPKGEWNYSVLLWAETACAEIPSAVRDPKPCRYCSGVQEMHGRRAPREDCPHFYCFLLHCDYSLIWFPMCTLCCLSHDFRSQHSFWSNSDLQIHSSHACIQEVPCVQPHGPNSHLE